MRVLLIEDNESDAILVEEQLAEASGEVAVEWVESLTEGLARLADERFDAVLLDLSLPDSRGLETFDSVHAAAPDVPIVVFTGLDDEEAAAGAAVRGAQDYLVKGELTGRILVRSLRYALERQRLHFEMRERVRELQCLYRMSACLREASSRRQACERLVEVVPSGWRYPTLASCRIRWGNEEYATAGFRETEARLEAPIEVNGQRRGRIEVCYSALPASAPEEPFLDEERVLLQAVAKAVGDYLEREQHEEDQRRLATVIEQTGDSVVITDPEGRILYVNQAFEAGSGWSRAEALGQNPRILKSGVQDEGFYRDLWGTITRGKQWRGRFVNRRKDGSLYQEDATISPVRDAAGNIDCYVAVKKDVTREVELERQLRRSQRLEAVGQVAGGVAHDFNNLLTVILGNIDSLLDGDEGEELNREALEDIEAATQRASDLTRQLLIFSRRQEVEPQILELNRLVERFEALLRRVLREDVELEIRPSAEPVLVKADPGQLEQVIMNLVINARDASTSGGRITIRVKQRLLGEDERAEIPAGSYAVLAVRDNGIGMTREVLEHAFEPFFTTKQIGHGTGLGLSTVYGIACQSGGCVDIQTEPGRGTEVAVLLPVVGPADTVDPSAAAEAGRGRAPRGPGGTERVLVVEDDESVRSMIAGTLGRSGYSVVEAEDGEAAWRLLAARPEGFDLVVTDAVMPGMGGAMLVDRVQRLPRAPAVLVLSGYTDERIERQIQQRGCRFVQKPFTASSLLRAVRSTLSPQDEESER